MTIQDLYGFSASSQGVTDVANQWKFRRMPLCAAQMICMLMHYYWEFLGEFAAVDCNSVRKRKWFLRAFKKYLLYFIAVAVACVRSFQFCHCSATLCSGGHMNFPCFVQFCSDFQLFPKLAGYAELRFLYETAVSCELPRCKGEDEMVPRSRDRKRSQIIKIATKIIKIHGKL